MGAAGMEDSGGKNGCQIIFSLFCENFSEAREMWVRHLKNDCEASVYAGSRRIKIRGKAAQRGSSAGKIIRLRMASNSFFVTFYMHFRQFGMELLGEHRRVRTEV